jgi:hypothetical protein
MVGEDTMNRVIALGLAMFADATLGAAAVNGLNAQSEINAIRKQSTKSRTFMVDGALQ